MRPLKSDTFSSRYWSQKCCNISNDLHGHGRSPTTMAINCVYANSN